MKRLRLLFLSVFFALLGLLFGTSSVWAQSNDSATHWLFYVKGSDLSACLEKPVDLVGGGYYVDHVASSLSMPSQVSDNVRIYTVSETGNELTTEQRKALTSIFIPNSVTIISGNAFNNSSLQSIEIPSSVTTIGVYAFQSDSSLVSVTVPASVTSVGGDVFENCTALQSATVLNSTIGDYQFANCTALKDVTISNDVNTIGIYAFRGCRNLETLTVPASVTSIYSNGGNSSFTGMTGLKTLNFYAKNVPDHSFYGLPIENLDLAEVETIANYAFSNCAKLKDLVLPNSLQTIGQRAFSGDSSLLSVTIPTSVVTAMDANTFENCTSMQNATVLNNTIGSFQFNNCSSLKEVTLSNNIMSIANSAFQGCVALTDVTVAWATPLSLPTNQNIFTGVNTSAATLHVPAGTKALYQVAPVWKDFGNIVELAAPITPTLSVSPDSLNFASTGGEKTFIITSNTDWSIPSTISWLTVSSASGSNNETVTVTATPNTTSVQRNASISVTGTSVDPITISITQDAAPNLDSIAVNNAKAIIEAATYAVSQSVANTEETIKAWLVQQINALPGMSDTGITVTADDITFDSFNPAVTDNGNFAFTVSLTKGSSQTTASKNGTITFTMPAFVPVTNIIDVPATATVGVLNISGTVVPDNATNKIIVWRIKDAGTTGASMDSGVSYQYIDGVLTPVTNISFTTTSAGTLIMTATVAKGNADGTDYTQDFPITITTIQNPDLDAVNAAKAIIEAADYTVLQDTANTEETVKAWLVEQINALPEMNNTGISVTEDDITLDSFNPAVSNTTNGSFVFTVSLTKGSSQTTATQTGKILYLNITLLTTVTVGTPISLNSLIPSNLNYGYITCALKDAGTTGAFTESQSVTYQYIDGILTPVVSVIINTKAEGTIIFTANFYNRIKGNSDWTLVFSQDFTINVIAAPTYNLTISTFTGGSVTSDKAAYEEGETVSLNVVPDDGYELDSVSAYKTGDPATVVALDGTDDARTLTMPAFDVTVMATFKEIPAIVPIDSTKIGDDGKGTISLNLTIPGNANVTGSFEIRFPDGMTLDEQLTVLSLELSGHFSLAFTIEGNNTWLIEIKSNTLRSSTASEFTKIMDIAFTVDDSVAKGTYEATITNLDLLLDDGTPIKEDLLTVPINVERVATSINPIGNSSFYACFINSSLKIESPQAETITIYSATGVRLYSEKKDAGLIEIPFSSIPGSVYIITGSKSGAIKILK